MSILLLIPRFHIFSSFINALSTQSKNQVIRFGVSILKKSEKTIESNHNLEKRHCNTTLLLLPGLQPLSFSSPMLWMCPVQKLSLFGRCMYILKVGEYESQTFWAIKVKK